MTQASIDEQSEELASAGAFFLESKFCLKLYLTHLFLRVFYPHIFKNYNISLSGIFMQTVKIFF
jgi:hypothetical protein